MSDIDQGRATQTADKAADKSASRESGPAVQLKQQITGLPYRDQVQQIKPQLPLGVSLDGPVQTSQGATGDSGEIREAAASGLTGSAQQLPHLATIQHSFGHHDLSGVKAHVGGAAAKANEAMGSEAYATGNNAAFKSTPDLHTAAHEAAHVVQQRAGVSLPGGVGQVGDKYEKNADQVADRVVNGRPASDLLDGGSGSPGLQMRSLQLRADEALRQGTEVEEDFLKLGMAQLNKDPALKKNYETWIKENGKKPKSVEEVVAAIHGMHTRDAYFNNYYKVQFENELGAALVADRASFEPVVDKVLKWCYKYIEEKSKAATKAVEGEVSISLEAAISAELKKMHMMYGDDHEGNALKDVFFGRVMDTYNEVEFNEKMLELFKGEGGASIPQKCLTIQSFHNNIYEVDFKADKSLQQAGVKALLTKCIPASLAGGKVDIEAIDPKEVRDNLESEAAGGGDASDIFGSTEAGREEAAEHENLDPKKKGKGADRRGRYQSRKHKPSSTSTEGLSAREPARGSGTRGPEAAPEGVKQGQKHGRGIDRWTMDERQAFIQQARMLDMPLAGSVSGTTSDLITVAILAGMEAGSQNAFKFVCGALAHFIGAGAHTFHEVVTAATAAKYGITYEAGNYSGFFENYMKSGFTNVKKLFSDAKKTDSIYHIRGIGKPW